MFTQQSESSEQEEQMHKLVAGPWELEREIGHHDGPGKLTKARGIAVSPNGDIGIASQYGSEVCVYGNDGTYKLSLDTKEELDPGSKSMPWSVMVNANGHWYVTNKTHYVRMYSPQGVYISKWEAVSPNTVSNTGNTALCGLTKIGSNGHLLVGQVEPRVLYISRHTSDGSHVDSIRVGISPWYLATI